MPQDNLPAKPERKPEPQPEPWLRGTLEEVPPIQRAVRHALDLAREDIDIWCGSFNDAELHARPFDLPPVAFQLRHVARSLDRFMTYAEGRALNAEQLAALASEMEPRASREEIFGEFEQSVELTVRRLNGTQERALGTPLRIGRKGLPTTLGGLLVHTAEHTQRHIGQAITTAKVVLAQRA